MVRLSLPMKPLDELLKDYESKQGNLCPGTMLAVRMALRGCAEVGIDRTQRNADKALIVWVEIDRWLSDALNLVAGVSLSKRTLKFLDYGKLAATFFNSQTGAAVRIVACESTRELAETRHPELETKYERQMRTYYEATDEELFKITPAEVKFDLHDRPGRPRSRVICDKCGEGVNDRREVQLPDNKVLCRPCAATSRPRSATTSQPCEPDQPAIAPSSSPSPGDDEASRLLH